MTVQSPFFIRAARVDDAAEIARLNTELGYPSTAEKVATRLSALLARPDHFVAVAAASEAHLLGWIAAEHRFLLHYDARAELIGLVVGSDAKRRGIGRTLVRTAEDWAAARGLTEIFVRSSVARSEAHQIG